MADQFFWTSAGGTTINLSDPDAGYSVLASGTSGLRSVTYETVESSFAGFDGTTMDLIKAAPTDVTLGIMVQPSPTRGLRDQVRALARAMRPKAGMGTLTARWADGQQRSLGCYCIGGLEGSEDVDATMVNAFWKSLLRLRAPDPWWLGEEQAIRFGLGAPVPFFPIPPVTVSPSTVQGQFALDLSDMDAPAFPVWTITGPGSALVLRNETTGRSLSVNVSLAAAETLTIDTRPNLESIRLGSGSNAMPLVSGFPDLWPLKDAVNNLSVTLTGATAATAIVGTYRPRYAGI